MNLEKILIFSAFSLISLFITSVFAVPPSLPHTFYGKLYLSNGNPVPAGLTLVAKINNTQYGSTTTSDGRYDYLLVTDPNNQNQGKTIYFYVNDIQATQTYIFKNGEFTELNLTLTAPIPTTITTTTVPSGPGGGGPSGPSGGTTGTGKTTTTTITSATCGNGKCETGETCSNCQKDCGACGNVNITVVDLIIPENVTADKPFILQVVVKNVGNKEGFDDITVSIPTGWSTSVWGQRVTLKPGDAKTLYFTITPNEDSGKIAAGSSTGFLVSDTINPLKMEGENPLGITGFAVLLKYLSYWWIILIVVTILVLIYLARRKPSRKKPYEYKHKKK